MDASFRPAYLSLAQSGALDDRSSRLDAILSCCTLCPHECEVDRSQVLGECGTGVEANLRWLATAMSPQAGVSLRAPHRSCHGREATEAPAALDRDLTREEWAIAQWAASEHLHRSERVFLDGPGS